MQLLTLPKPINRMRWSLPKHDFHHKEFLQNKEIIGSSKKRTLTIRPQKQQQQQKRPMGNNVMLQPPIILPTTTILSPTDDADVLTVKTTTTTTNDVWTANDASNQAKGTITCWLCSHSTPCIIGNTSLWRQSTFNNNNNKGPAKKN